ncbi:hypothetical protein ACFQ58_07835 [Agromyces sp. NPDC056523]|uniref:hypothetical protein n=1 Tax=Agromyces sp. NPDC056523 TaxID=3345850 RepID=UPI00366CD562
MALALAACGALSLAAGEAMWFGIPSSDDVPTLLFIVGWLFVVWAIVVGGLASAPLMRTVRHGRGLSLIDAVLWGATIAVIAGSIWLYPLAGSGAGAG